MNVLLIGAPGSGKGTQAGKLVSAKQLRHLSTGDLFRKNIKEGTPLGQKAKSYIDKGLLAPDQLTNDMVEDYLRDIPLEDGLLFDGFPRSLPQAIALDRILNRLSRSLDHVIFLDISDEEALSRLSGRLWAPKSRSVYHIKNNPPKREGFCDQSGEALITRPDDQKEVIFSRLKVFHKESQALIERYKAKKLLKIIPAESSPEEIFCRIQEVLS